MTDHDIRRLPTAHLRLLISQAADELERRVDHFMSEAQLRDSIINEPHTCTCGRTWTSAGSFNGVEGVQPAETAEHPTTDPEAG